MTQAPTTAGVAFVARILIVAETGPSEMSSYQPALPQKSVMPLPPGEADVPAPPSTSRWFASSLRISPSGTVVTGSPEKRIAPLSNSCCWSGPVVLRAPGSIVRSPAGSLLPRPGIGRLLVDQVHRPGDVGLGVGDLLDGAVVVVREDAEARRLALDAALRVLEAAGRLGPLAEALRADEELRAVADPRDADRRMDAIDGGHCESPWDLLRGGPI